MAKINLLPWREKLRAKRKKEFIEAAGLAAVVGGIIVFLWSAMLSLQIEHQIARNDRLKEEITKLDAEIEEVKNLEKKKSVLVSRMKIISGLQANRPYIVHIFDELVRTLPEGVYYKSIKRVGDKLTIDGVADSNESVSALMKRMDMSKWFKPPLLTSVINKTTSSAAKNKNTQADESVITFNLIVSEEGSPEAAAKNTSKQGSTK